MKKLFIILGSLFLLLVALVIAIPLFVDVDKYRPQIVEAANEHLNGTLELGKLKLSLWGKIRIEVSGLKLKDAKGETVVGVNDAYFHLPFMSLISGSPEVNLYLDRPSVLAVKDKQGKLNLVALAKTSGAPAAPTGAAGTSGAAAGKPANAANTPARAGAPTPVATQAVAVETPTSRPAEKTQELPAIATRARLGLDLVNAFLSYRDDTTALTTQVKDLNVRLRDLSLSRETKLEVWADLDTRMGKDLILKGPMRLDGTAKPDLAAKTVETALKLNLDDVEMTQGTLFHKAKGLATNASLKATAGETTAKLHELVIKFFNAEVKASGGMVKSASDPNAEPTVDFKASSNEVDLASWEQLVPMLKEYALSGRLGFNASGAGPSSKLNYQAQLDVKSLKATAPHLKAPPEINATIHVITDQVDSILATLKAPGTDAKLTGKVVSFTKPNVDLALTSGGMDLDQWIEIPKEAPAKKGARLEWVSAAHAATEPAKVEDLDASLDSLRSNPAMAAMVLHAMANLKFVKSQGMRMDDVAAKFTMANLVATLENFSWRMFGGTLKLAGSSQLRPKQPTYSFSANVDKLDLKQAVESNVKMFKNTLLGKAQFAMNGSGASFNTEPMLRNLNAKGSLKVSDAKFASIDVGKMVREGINGAIGKIGDKIPAMKGKQVGNLPNGESKYEFISSSFTIGGGKFSAPDFYAKAMAQQGVDIRGSTSVGMIDKSLSTSWEIIDTYNLTKAYDISVNQQGVQVDHILSEGGAPVKFPVSAGGTIDNPQYSYTQVPEYLAKVALNNATKAATGKVKAEAKKKVEQIIQQQAPDAVKDKLKKLGGGLFGH